MLIGVARRAGGCIACTAWHGGHGVGATDTGRTVGMGVAAKHVLAPLCSAARGGPNSDLHRGESLARDVPANWHCIFLRKRARYGVAFVHGASAS